MQAYEKPKKPQHTLIVQRMLLGLCLVALVGIPAVSAATLDLNGTIGPILDSITDLIPSIINLIVSIVPAVIVMSVVGFIVAFFDKVLSMMKL